MSFGKNMWLPALLVLPSMCIAFDYREGCAFGMRNKQMNNTECKNKLKASLDDGSSNRVTFHEENIELWVFIFKLAHQYDYQFAKSMKIITAATRVADRIA